MHRLILPAALVAASFLFVAAPSASQAATPEPIAAGSVTDISAQEGRFERRMNRQFRRMTRPHMGPRCVTERARIVRPNGAVTFRTVQRCR